MHRVLITGVRAKTGAPLATLLADRADVEVRGGTSDPSRVDVPGVGAVRFTWDDPASWEAATAGVDGIFVVRPDRPDAPELITALLAAAPAQAHVVLLSELDGGYFDHDAWALRVERAVQDSGHTWTVLRPGWFMQVFSDQRFYLDPLRNGQLAFPSGGQPVAWIDARDIADVAARALLDPVHRSRTYDLTGPEALTLAETAEVLGAALGHRVEPVEPTMEEALEGREGFDRENEFGALDRVRRGFGALVTTTVADLTGRPARTLAEFVASEPALTPASR
ncbi:NAD(P)H-binding protein [Desertihabitans aurantiacus]|uniref:NAD(P)H-binding protein n=1 Tax=Desertihabitans aurantiacus TaxID=2282477 RepID=UPI000DF78FD8|nr:NAD(P)H-binding protein [Desertihabitans aurantiacus]